LRREDLPQRDEREQRGEAAEDEVARVRSPRCERDDRRHRKGERDGEQPLDEARVAAIQAV